MTESISHPESTVKKPLEEYADQLAEFKEFVEYDYGSEIAKEFSDAFTKTKVVWPLGSADGPKFYVNAMEILDQILDRYRVQVQDARTDSRGNIKLIT